MPRPSADSCPVKAYQWTIILGCALVLLAQFPDLGSSDALTSTCSAFLLFYSIAAMALAGTQGELWRCLGRGRCRSRCCWGEAGHGCADMQRMPAMSLHALPAVPSPPSPHPCHRRNVIVAAAPTVLCCRRRRGRRLQPARQPHGQNHERLQCHG